MKELNLQPIKRINIFLDLNIGFIILVIWYGQYPSSESIQEHEFSSFFLLIHCWSLIKLVCFWKEYMPAKLRNSINAIKNKNNFSHWDASSILNYGNEKQNPFQHCDSYL